MIDTDGPFQIFLTNLAKFHNKKNVHVFLVMGHKIPWFKLSIKHSIEFFFI